jgi:DNA-binding IclR family transcriptional regulator
VPGLQRGLMLLAQFRHDRRTLTGAELARNLGLPRASVFRILQTLEQMGFVERVNDSAHYRLGFAVLRLGFEFLASMELTDQGKPVLQDLSDATGLSGNLVVLDGTEAVVVARTLGRSALQGSLQIGARLPAHATVLGRMLLARLSLSQLLERFGPGPYQRYTDTTPITPDDLLAQVRADAQRGYGVSQSGFESGICAIAAPVFDDQRAVCATIGITVPTVALSATQQRELVPIVLHAADRLSRRLGQIDHPSREPHSRRALAA